MLGSYSRWVSDAWQAPASRVGVLKKRPRVRPWPWPAVSPLYGPPPAGVEMAWRPGAADFLAALAGLGYRPLGGGPPADRADPAGGTPGSAARAGRPSRAARAARRATAGGAEPGPAAAPLTPAAVEDVLAALQRVCRALVAVVRHGVRRRAAGLGARGRRAPAWRSCSAPAASYSARAPGLSGARRVTAHVSAGLRGAPAERVRPGSPSARRG